VAAGGEDPVAVLADRASEPHERLQAAARQARQEPVDQLGDGVDGEARSEDRADRLLQRPGARDLTAGGVQRGERVGLALGEVLGVLQQRPAAVFEVLGGVWVAGAASSFQWSRRTSSSALVASCTTW